MAFGNQAFAKDLCDVYRNYTPLPDWYNQMCNAAGGGFKAKAGGAFSSYADAFNLNPASLPTFKTPFGIEYISSIPRSAGSKTQSNFGVIKGYQRIGTGISTNADNTFYSNSTIQTSQATEGGSYLSEALNSNYLAPSLNLGAAAALLENGSASKFKPNLGGLIRYNKLTGSWNPGFGHTANSDHV